MVRNKTMIAFTTGESVRRPDFYDYLSQMIRPENALITPNHGRSPARGRNQCIDAAIEFECTHILLIDDDMQFQPDALIRLLEHDVDIVSGLYVSRAYPHQPLVFDIADDEGAAFPMYLMEKPTLKPIVAAGFGFLLIKTDVFKKLQKPYVRLGELNNEEWCDDIGFFKRVREAGIQSYVDMTVVVGHIGTVISTPHYNEKTDEWYTVYDTGGSGVIHTPQMHLKCVKNEVK